MCILLHMPYAPSFFMILYQLKSLYVYEFQFLIEQQQFFKQELQFHVVAENSSKKKKEKRKMQQSNRNTIFQSHTSEWGDHVARQRGESQIGLKLKIQYCSATQLYSMVEITQYLNHILQSGEIKWADNVSNSQ